MPLLDAIAWLQERVGSDGYEAIMPRGTEVEWYSPITAAEKADEQRYAQASAERTERWERETYERLRAKYEGGAP